MVTYAFVSIHHWIVCLIEVLDRDSILIFYLILNICNKVVEGFKNLITINQEIIIIDF